MSELVEQTVENLQGLEVIAPKEEITPFGEVVTNGSIGKPRQLYGTKVSAVELLGREPTEAEELLIKQDAALER